MEEELKCKYLVVPNKFLKYGSLGELILLKDKFTSNPSAAKVIKNIIINDVTKVGVVNKLKNEVEALKLVSKQSRFIRLKEAFRQNDNQYLVYDYHEDLLCDFIKKQQNSLLINNPDAFFKVFDQVISIVTLLNDNGIFVENLNWNNFIGIMSSKGLNIKFVDFGISYVIEEGDLSSSFGVPITFSPEFFSEKKPSSNLEANYSWVLGILLFQLTYLAHPFGFTLNEILSNINKIVEFKILVIDCINCILKQSIGSLNSIDQIEDEIILLITQLLSINPKSRIPIKDIRQKLMEIFKINNLEPEETEESIIISSNNSQEISNYLNTFDNVNSNSNQSVINTSKLINISNDQVQTLNVSKPNNSSNNSFRADASTNLNSQIPTYIKSNSQSSNSLKLNNSFSNPILSNLLNDKSPVKSKFELASILFGQSEHNLSYPYNYFPKNNLTDYESIGNVTPDYSKAFAILKEIDHHFSSNKINESSLNFVYYLKAINLLGICYEKGLGTLANSKEAVASYRKTIKLEFIPGKINLARSYFTGFGNKKSVNTGNELIEQTKLSTNFEDFVMLSYLYLGRDTIPINIKVATEYYNKALSFMACHPIIDNLLVEINKVKNSQYAKPVGK